MPIPVTVIAGYLCEYVEGVGWRRLLDDEGNPVKANAQGVGHTEAKNEGS